MSAFLEKVTIAKGKTAEQSLTKLKWPKDTHQKIIDKSYNKAFRKFATKSTEKLAKTAALEVPKMLPKEYKALITSMKALIKVAANMAKKRESLEYKLKDVKELNAMNADGNIKYARSLEKEAKKFKAEADHLIDSCVASVDLCAGIKYPHQVIMERYQKKNAQFERLWKAILKTAWDKPLYVGPIKDALKALAKEEDLLKKNAAKSLGLAIGYGLVMP